MPLSTAYSISETFGRKADINDSSSHALGRADRIATGIALAVIAVSVLALGVLAAP